MVVAIAVCSTYSSSKILLQENMTEKYYILNETVKQHFFDKIS